MADDSGIKLRERKSDLEIKKVCMTCDERPKGLSPVLDWNAFYLICGQPGSGKTVVLHNLFNRRDKKVFYKKFHKIFLFSPSLHTVKKKIPIPDEQKFSEFTPEILQDLINGLDQEQHALFIFDDMMKEMNQPANLSVLTGLIANRRHTGAGSSIIMTTQKWNKIPRTLRTAVSNIIMFNKSKIEINDIYDEFCGLSRKQFEKICRFVFKNKHDFLYMRTDQPEYSKYHRNFNPIEIEVDEIDLDDNAEI